MDPVLLTTFGTLIVLLIFTVPIGVSIGTAVFMGMMVVIFPRVPRAENVQCAGLLPPAGRPLLHRGWRYHAERHHRQLPAGRFPLSGRPIKGLAHISILTSLTALGSSPPPPWPPWAASRSRHGEGGCGSSPQPWLHLRLSRHYDPPSIPLILFGSTAGVSISDLFVAPSFPASSWAAPSLGELTSSRAQEVQQNRGPCKFSEMLKACAKPSGPSWCPSSFLAASTAASPPHRSSAIAVVYALFVEVFITRSATRKCSSGSSRARTHQRRYLPRGGLRHGTP